MIRITNRIMDCVLLKIAYAVTGTYNQNPIHYATVKPDIVFKIYCLHITKASICDN